MQTVLLEWETLLVLPGLRAVRRVVLRVESARPSQKNQSRGQIPLRDFKGVRKSNDAKVAVRWWLISARSSSGSLRHGKVRCGEVIILDPLPHSVTAGQQPVPALSLGSHLLTSLDRQKPMRVSWVSSPPWPLSLAHYVREETLRPRTGSRWGSRPWLQACSWKDPS